MENFALINNAQSEEGGIFDQHYRNSENPTHEFEDEQNQDQAKMVDEV